MTENAPEITAAIIAAIVSLAGFIASAAMAGAKIGAAERETQKNLELASRRLRREFQLEFAAETAVRALLEDPRWELRRFAVIQRHLGGFEDNELRRLLVRAGAVCFRSSEGDELWGLLQRNCERLGLDTQDRASHC